MAAGRRALVVATYEYADGGLRRLTAPEHDADSFAEVLKNPAIAGFDVTMLVNQPHYVVGEAIADFYTGAGRDDLTLLYFTGHGVKDDEGRLYLAMTNTRREALMFTAISGAQLNDAMDSSRSRRKVLILDCCYSGAFPAGRTAKSDEGVHTLERFQGRGRAVLTASDATQYAFEGDDVRGTGTSSVFTRHLVEAISSGAADLDEDGDIALDELYSYVYDHVVAEMPQQRPKKQEDVDGRILIARNVHWMLPAHLQHAVESPIAAQRSSAVQELEYLHRAGNDIVRAAVVEQVARLTADDSRSVSAAATELLDRLGTAVPGTDPTGPRRPVPAEEPAPVASGPAHVTPSLPPMDTPMPRSAASTVPDAAADPGTSEPDGAAAPGAPAVPAPSRRGIAPAVLLAVMVVAGVLLTVSRFVVFEGTNGYHAVDLGWSTVTWVVQVLLPLVLAAGVLLAGAGSPVSTALAGGLVAGVTISLVSQLLMFLGVYLDPDVGYRIGPAWWLILAAVVLLGVGVAVVATVCLGDRPHRRRNRRSAAAAVLVVGSAVAWAISGDVSIDFGWRVFLQFAGLLLCVAGLPVAVLDLDERQRLFGLAAVTTTGAWLVTVAVETLVVHPPGYQPRALTSAVIATFATVGGAWLGQWRSKAPRPAAGG